MKKLLLLSAIFSLLSVTSASQAFGQTSDLRTRFLRCSSIESSFNRIQCYDDLAKDVRGSESVTRYTPTPVPTATPADRIVIQSRNPISCSGKSIRPEILIACKDGVLSMELDVKTELGAGDILLNIRYDADEVIRNLRWRIRPDGRTIYSLRQEELAHEIAKRENFEVKLLPPNSDPLAFSFDLAAQGAAMKSVVSACDQKR
jgi:hypothetical protein